MIDNKIGAKKNPMKDEDKKYKATVNGVKTGRPSQKGWSRNNAWCPSVHGCGKSVRGKYFGVEFMYYCDRCGGKWEKKPK